MQKKFFKWSMIVDVKEREWLHVIMEELKDYVGKHFFFFFYKKAYFIKIEIETFSKTLK